MQVICFSVINSLVLWVIAGNPCLNMGKQKPTSMYPVQPGLLLPLMTVPNLPPTQAPLPLLTDSDVEEPPLPAVSTNSPSNNTGGNSMSPTSPRQNGQPRNTGACIMMSLTMLLGSYLLIWSEACIWFYCNHVFILRWLGACCCMHDGATNPSFTWFPAILLLFIFQHFGTCRSCSIWSFTCVNRFFVWRLLYLFVWFCLGDISYHGHGKRSNIGYELFEHCEIVRGCWKFPKIFQC